MEEWLGDNGLGCLTLLPLPLALLVVLLGAVGAAGVAALFVGSTFACCGGLMVFAIVDRSLGTIERVEVVGHRWERVVEVEELTWDRDEDWCDQIPDDVRIIDVEERWHHRDRRIGPDKDIYEDWCTYEALLWKRVDELERSGDSTDPAPSWPAAPDDGCEREGCQRPGDREESLEVLFERVKGHEGDPWDCEMPHSKEWLGWHEGDEADVLVGGLGGRPYCSELTRRSPPHAAPEPAPRERPDPDGRPERRPRPDRPRRGKGGKRRGR